MVSIGEFSRLTHLTVKALRHYHDVGVLTPAAVEPSNGYRQYDLTQLADAHLVKRLRDLDMPLDEVRTVLGATADDRDKTIAGHLERMEGELARTRSVVASLRELIETPTRPLAVSVDEFDAVAAIATRAIVGVHGIEEWSSATFAGLEAAVGAAGLESNGPPGSLFSAAFFAEGIGEVTAFLPVANAGADSSPGYELLTIAGGQFAMAVHHGSYQDLDRTYGLVGGFVNEQALGRDGPLREQYLIGPDQATDPGDYRTQLLWPVST